MMSVRRVRVLEPASLAGRVGDDIGPYKPTVRRVRRVRLDHHQYGDTLHGCHLFHLRHLEAIR